MKKTLIIVLLPAIALLVSCKKYFGDINTNPNNPNNVNPNVILPAVQGGMSYTFGGDGARFSTILSQQIKGVSRQWAVLEQYNFVGEDVNTLFGINIYTNILKELKELKTISDRDGLNHYNGIAKIMEAYTLLFVADFWDSAPYSEAFQGIDNLQPKYDNQTTLYATITQLLNDGRQDLSLASGIFVPGSDDLFYNGDVSKWIGLANFIEARMNLRLAKTDNTKYQDALTLIGTGLVADFEYAYTGGAFGHPMFQFNQQRGDCSIGTRISELLTTLNDPRNALFNQTFDESNTYITANKSHKMATLVEQRFIEAECTFHVSGATAAHPIYMDAIQMALTAEGILAADITTYIGQASVDPGSGNLTLEHIINQKYLALFLHHETYTDWRRTGFPTLTPNTGTQVPRRFPVSQKELNLNGANAPQVTIYTPVSWDN